MVLAELDIRIEKIRAFEEQAKTEDIRRFQAIRLNEYLNFRNWILLHMEEDPKKKISTGEPNTLGTYKKIALAISGGRETEATRFMDKKIEESPQGENEIVLADERQMLILLVGMTTKTAV